ncbi:hypothetical protein D3C84_1078130 [compost metagenome]
MIDHVLFHGRQIHTAHSEFHGHWLCCFIPVTPFETRRTRQIREISVTCCIDKHFGTYINSAGFGGKLHRLNAIVHRLHVIHKAMKKQLNARFF